MPKTEEMATKDEMLQEGEMVPALMLAPKRKLGQTKLILFVQLNKDSLRFLEFVVLEF